MHPEERLQQENSHLSGHGVSLAVDRIVGNEQQIPLFVEKQTVGTVDIEGDQVPDVLQILIQRNDTLVGGVGDQYAVVLERFQSSGGVQLTDVRAVRPAVTPIDRAAAAVDEADTMQLRRGTVSVTDGVAVLADLDALTGRRDIGNRDLAGHVSGNIELLHLLAYRYCDDDIGPGVGVGSGETEGRERVLQRRPVGHDALRELDSEEVVPVEPVGDEQRGLIRTRLHHVVRTLHPGDRDVSLRLKRVAVIDFDVRSRIAYDKDLVSDRLDSVNWLTNGQSAVQNRNLLNSTFVFA